MDNGTIIVMILPAFIVYLIFVLIDEFTVGNEKTTPSLSLTIPVKASAFDAMKDISAFIACQNRYRIDYFHPEKYHVVLNQGMSFRHFGFCTQSRLLMGRKKRMLWSAFPIKSPLADLGSEESRKCNCSVWQMQLEQASIQVRQAK